MPRRGRKRRLSQSVGCGSPSKRRPVSGYQKVSGEQIDQHGSVPGNAEHLQELALAKAREKDQEDTPTITTLEYLARCMPPELLTLLQAEPPHPWQTRSTSNAIVPSLSLCCPSFCIGHLTLSLKNGGNLRGLLSHILLPNLCSQLYLNDGFLEVLVDDSKSFSLPVSVSPQSFPLWCLRSSGPYVTQLVLKMGEVAGGGGEGDMGGGRRSEKGEGYYMECHISDSGVGDSDSSGNVELELDSTGVGLSLREEVSSGLTADEVTCGTVEVVGGGGGGVGGGGCVEGEGGRGGGVDEVSGGGGREVTDGNKSSRKGGNGGGVHVEVWVGEGEVCDYEPGNPNALPPRGNIQRLVQLVESFHPRPLQQSPTPPGMYQ